MKCQVHYVFGRREKQGLPGYLSAPTTPFVFPIEVEALPSSWESAYALLGFYREELIQACHAAKICMTPGQTEAWESWIPECYLDQPTIEVSEGEGYEELLIDGQKPNRWLSRPTGLIAA